MNCMKCGVEIPENHVFCDHCLAVMEDYPIKPDTHIHLPKRNDIPESAKRGTKKKRTPSAEEKISALRMKVLRLRLVVVILIFLLCVISALFGLHMYGDIHAQPATGQNYTIDTSTKPPLPTATVATTGK